MVENSVGMNSRNFIKCVVYKVDDYSIHPLEEWTCIKDEHEVDGKIKEHDQWCRVRTRILGRGNRYRLLLGKLITFISIE
jgi:hypothetical protein